MIKVTIKCDLCGACVGICSELALEMTEKELIFTEDFCNYCLKCIKICPFKALLDYRKK